MSYRSGPILRGTVHGSVHHMTPQREHYNGYGRERVTKDGIQKEAGECHTRAN